MFKNDLVCDSCGEYGESMNVTKIVEGNESINLCIQCMMMFNDWKSYSRKEAKKEKNIITAIRAEIDSWEFDS